MTGAWYDALVNLAWSSLGFLGGFIVGRMSRDVRDACADHADTSQESPVMPQQAPRRLAHALVGRVIGVLLILLALATLLASALSLQRQEEAVACQTRYAEAVARALNARTQVAAEDRAALVGAVLGVNAVTATDPLVREAEVRVALDGYLTAIRQGDERRAQNPLPDPPSVACPS